MQTVWSTFKRLATKQMRYIVNDLAVKVLKYPSYNEL